ncbi:MAG: ABC transporter substrate binding protein [Gammaproteobacteria bacterium]
MDKKLKAMMVCFLRPDIVMLICFCFAAPTVAAEPTGLVLRADGEVFAEVLAGLSSDVEGELRLVELKMSKNISFRDIKKEIKKVKPHIIILIGNSAMNVYTQYQNRNPNQAFPPAVALAALYVNKLVEKMSNTTGIRYEIPAVTSLVNMRALLDQQVKKVGVVYRSWMQDVLDENTAYTKLEGINLVGHVLPNRDQNMVGKLRAAISKLLDEKVDAFWIINDNTLLNRETFVKAWLPLLGDSSTPVVVGVKSLVESNLNFGVYAIVPDHYALGIQAASMVFDIMDANWSIDGIEIQQPISVKKIVNMKVVSQKGIHIVPEKLTEVDNVIH